jgi:hypothetical protein
MERNMGFSVRESGVGGILVVVPIERLSVGGLVERKVRMCEGVVLFCLGKTYYGR